MSGIADEWSELELNAMQARIAMLGVVSHGQSWWKLWKDIYQSVRWPSVDVVFGSADLKISNAVPIAHEHYHGD